MIVNGNSEHQLEAPNKTLPNQQAPVETATHSVSFLDLSPETRNNIYSLLYAIDHRPNCEGVLWANPFRKHPAIQPRYPECCHSNPRDHYPPWNRAAFLLVNYQLYNEAAFSPYSQHHLIFQDMDTLGTSLDHANKVILEHYISETSIGRTWKPLPKPSDGVVAKVFRQLMRAPRLRRLDINAWDSTDAERAFGPQGGDISAALPFLHHQWTRPGGKVERGIDIVRVYMFQEDLTEYFWEGTGEPAGEDKGNGAPPIVKYRFCKDGLPLHESLMSWSPRAMLSFGKFGGRQSEVRHYGDLGMRVGIRS